MIMTSEDGDISNLLSEPILPEELAEASGPDDFFPAILEAIIKSKEKEVELSPEEATWADSCFVQTSELSDVDWGAMRKVLLDSLEKPIEEPCDITEVMHRQGTNVISEGEAHTGHVEEDTQNDDMDIEQQGSSYDDEDATEVGEAANVIRGADGHGKQVDGYTTAEPDDGDELVSSEVAEQAESRDSIFKVWDLGVSVSDDEIELVKDLKKLLRDKPQEAAYPPPSDTAKALSEINIDELVSGLSDLSLHQTSECRPSNGDAVAGKQ
jgi:hypothetical protein